MPGTTKTYYHMLQRAFEDEDVDTKLVVQILAAMGAQDVRACYLSRDEFCQAFKVSREFLQRFLEEHDVKVVQFNGLTGQGGAVWIPKLPLMRVLRELTHDQDAPRQLWIGPTCEQAPPLMHARVAALETRLDEAESSLRKLAHAS